MQRMSNQQHPTKSSSPHPLHDFDDAELVQMLVTGNRDAMEVIFDRYYRLVMRITLNIVRDMSEAQDVCQIVFTDFYRQARLFDPARGNLKTWLVQYAYGRSINSRRRLKSRGFYEQTEIEAINPAVLAGVTKLFDLESAETRRLIEQVLATVPDRQRVVIEGVCFQGMTMREVAEATGESIGNVQHSYYRGIEKLRKLLVEGIDRKTKREFGLGTRLEPKQQETGQEVAFVKTPTL